MKLSLKGVLIGGVVDIAASVLLGLPFAIYAMAKVDFSHLPDAEAPVALTAAIHKILPLYIGQLLVGMASSVLGGYVAAWLAKHDELLNGGLSSFLGIALGIYAMASGKDSSALWAQILLLLACPVFAIFGGDLKRRQRQHHALGR